MATTAKPKAAPQKAPAAAAAVPALPELPNVAEMLQAPAGMPEAFRDMAEKGVSQARDTYAKVKAASEEATDLIEDAFETTRQGGLDIGQTALDAVKANTDAAFKFAKEMMGVKTLSEAIELQTAFARDRFDAFSTQAKDMQALVTKVTEDAAKPVQDAVSKGLADLKAA